MRIIARWRRGHRQHPSRALGNVIYSTQRRTPILQSEYVVENVLVEVNAVTPVPQLIVTTIHTEDIKRIFT